MFRTGIVIALTAALAAGVSPLGAQQAAASTTPAGPTLAAASLSPQLAEQPATAPYSNSSNFALQR